MELSNIAKKHSRRKICNESCIYCGSRKDVTRDHVPPKALFTKPLPQNILTVPSCRKCNDSFSRDDQYFRDMLVNCDEVFFNPKAHAAKEKFWRSLEKPEAQKYKHFVVSNFTDIELTTPSGIYLGKRPAIKIDSKRIDRVIYRTAKAIYYAVHQHSVPSTHKIKIRYDDPYLSKPSGFIEYAGPVWQPLVTIGSDIFGYTYANAIDEPHSMVFLLVFYGKLWFYGLIMPIQLATK